MLGAGLKRVADMQICTSPSKGTSMALNRMVASLPYQGTESGDPVVIFTVMIYLSDT